MVNSRHLGAQGIHPIPTPFCGLPEPLSRTVTAIGDGPTFITFSTPQEFKVAQQEKRFQKLSHNTLEFALRCQRAPRLVRVSQHSGPETIPFLNDEKMKVFNSLCFLKKIGASPKR